MSWGGRRWARRIGSRVGAPPRWLGAGAAVLALATAMSGLFGGLKQVEPDGPPTVPVGVMNAGEPWNVTVVATGYTKDASPLRLQKPGDRWLVVRATVEVTADESRTDLRDVLRLRSVTGLIGKADDLGTKADQIYLLPDITHAQNLHPNVPQDLYFFWEQAGDVQPPRELELAIVGKTQRVDTLTGHREWLDPQTRALVRSGLKNLDA